MKAAKVIGRASDRDGMPIGEYNNNPILNTRGYDVIFSDGNILQYSANVIVENIFSQVDDEGYRYLPIHEWNGWFLKG